MPSTENYITQAAGDARYQALGSLGSSTPAQVDAGDTGTAGVSSSAARADHEHPVAITSSQLVPPGAWTSYTPTFGNTTVGNGSATGAYVQAGKIVHFKVRLLWGSTTSFSGNVDVSLPVAAVTNGGAGLAAATHAVSAWLLDSSSQHFIGLAVVGVDAANSPSATKARIAHTEAGNVGTVNATNPFTWAQNDIIVITGFYEAA